MATAPARSTREGRRSLPRYRLGGFLLQVVSFGMVVVFRLVAVAARINTTIRPTARTTPNTPPIPTERPKLSTTHPISKNGIHFSTVCGAGPPCTLGDGTESQPPGS